MFAKDCAGVLEKWAFFIFYKLRFGDIVLILESNDTIFVIIQFLNNGVSFKKIIDNFFVLLSSDNVGYFC